MYRCLAAAAGSTSRVLQHVSDGLQRLADKLVDTTHCNTVEKERDSLAPTWLNRSASSSQHGTEDSSICVSFTGEPDFGVRPNEELSLQANVKAVCDWLREVNLYSWLPLHAHHYHSRRRSGHWLSLLWLPPTSESAYHSLTYSVGLSSALLSDMEKSLTNTTAQQLGLPSRFRWPITNSTKNPEQGRASGDGDNTPRPSTFEITGTTTTTAALATGAATVAAAAAAPVNTTGMLWPTAMRTTTGATVPRPPSSSSVSAAAALTAALPALPSTVTAGQVFAPTASAVPTGAVKPKSVSSLSSFSHISPAEVPASGGGVLFTSTLEAYMVLLLTARTQALTRSGGQYNAFSGQEAAARQQSKLVLYTSDQVDPLLLRAAQLIGIPHLRVLQTVAGDRQLRAPASSSPTFENKKGDSVHHYNYTVDVSRLQARLVEDVAAGLYPVMVVGIFGSGLSGAVDPIAALGDFCKKLGVWYHLDASHGGPALLATVADDREDHASSFPFSCRTTTTAVTVQHRLTAFAAEFQRAALTADSLLVPAGGSSLPYAALPSPSLSLNTSVSGAVLLFVAHVRKVAWSVQTIGESRQSTFNQHLTPAVSDGDVLRVSPLAQTCCFLANQAAAALPNGAGCASHSNQSTLRRDSCVSELSCPCCQSKAQVGASLNPRSHLVRQVLQHQTLTYSVLHAIRSDGRFDASLDASLFGMVYLRWLMAADEVTHALARLWAAEIDATLRRAALMHRAATEEETCEGSPRNDDVPPIKLYVGVVQLQRRLWVRLSFGELPELLDDVEDCVESYKLNKADASKHNCPPSLEEVTDYVLRTLDSAARLVKPECSP